MGEPHAEGRLGTAFEKQTCKEVRSTFLLSSTSYSSLHLCWAENTPTPQTCEYYLQWQKEVIENLEKSILSWIFWVDPECNFRYPYKREAEVDEPNTHREGDVKSEAGEMEPRARTPGIARQLREARRDEDQIVLRSLWRTCSPARILIWDF